ncbi:hypothetical protein [Streptomyces sp. NPDC008001]|uniref:hypothetical protein n=1 Tax=Streptomyces sp. NPDC008001 TaxID=3364804 RepID=UPI0036E4E335
MAQLYARDIPLLQPPGRTDLLQVLWCPSEHAPDSSIPIELSWRTAADVTDVLAAPPEPFDADEDLYVPEPCVLAPEQVTEYPDSLELPEEVKQQIADPAPWRAAGIAIDDAGPLVLYDKALSYAPGWKIGGWAPWGLTDPVPRFCVACGAAMTPLLTISSSEWHRHSTSWIPNEDRGPGASDDSWSNPPGITVLDANHLQLYACPANGGHPHTVLVQ